MNKRTKEEIGLSEETDQLRPTTDFRWFAAWLFGLIVIWTGLSRSVEALAFKPNSFFFCLACGLIAIAAAWFFRARRERIALALSVVAFVLVFGFYTWCFIKQPEKDATIRVARVIVASVGFISYVAFPHRKK